MLCLHRLSTLSSRWRHLADRHGGQSVFTRLLALGLAAVLFAQAANLVAQPVLLTPPQLDQLVQRIALYPDPLLAQILTASTYWIRFPMLRPGPISTATSRAMRWHRPSRLTICNGIPACWDCCRFLRCCT